MACERFSEGGKAVTCKWPTLSFIYHSVCENGNHITDDEKYSSPRCTESLTRTCICFFLVTMYGSCYNYFHSTQLSIHCILVCPTPQEQYMPIVGCLPTLTHTSHRPQPKPSYSPKWLENWNTAKLRDRGCFSPHYFSNSSY